VTTANVVGDTLLGGWSGQEVRGSRMAGAVVWRPYAGAVPTYARRSARVLVVDGADRILLLRFTNDGLAGGGGWITPGGGVDDGESLVDAAARELREEIGLVVPPDQLGRPVAYCSGHDEHWPIGLLRDDFFLHRVDRHDVDEAGMEEFERTNHAGHRWWTLAELRTTTELVYPPSLASFLSDLLIGPPTTEPVELAWRL
jgi:8-oxo-dGTP pyrophosphatase MutT (NUDIX family)